MTVLSFVYLYEFNREWFEWSSDHLGDLPTWIIAIITPGSVAGGFIGTWLGSRRRKKIDEQKFFRQLDEIFMKMENYAISRDINIEINSSKSDGDRGSPADRIPTWIDKTRNVDVSRYLSDLEYLCILYEEKILTKEQITSRRYGNLISKALKSTSIRNFITNQRKETNDDNLYLKLEEIAKKLGLT